jgi:hypothetical protein
LFGGLTTGEVNLAFNHVTLDGFESATAGRLSFDEASGSFSARIELIQLSHAGEYSVTGSADPGYAMAAASSLLNISPHEPVEWGNAAEESAASDEVGRDGLSSPSEEKRPELARGYWDKLAR